MLQKPTEKFSRGNLGKILAEIFRKQCELESTGEQCVASKILLLILFAPHALLEGFPRGRAIWKNRWRKFIENFRAREACALVIWLKNFLFEEKLF